MYVATLCLPEINWLIRVDVRTTLAGTSAMYRRTDDKGDEDSYACPIGPDTHDVGLPTIAILTLIKDLNWCGIDGHIHVTHRGMLDQDDLIDILTEINPAYVLLNSMTTGTLQ